MGQFTISYQSLHDRTATSHRVKLTLLALCLLAFALRIGAVVWFKPWTPQKANAIEHRQLAINLVNGNGFAYRSRWGYFGPSSVQSPTYPIFLAALFETFGVDSPKAYATAMIVNSIAGAITVWLTYLVARTLGGDDLVGLVAAAACAVWPSQIYPATYAQAVCLITTGTVAIVVLFYRAVRMGRLWPWIGFSVVGMLAALTEPVLLPVMVVSGMLVLCWRSLAFSIRLRNAAVLFVVALAIVGPWTLRNHAVHGQWMPIKSTFWVNFWKGNNDFASGTDRVVMTDKERERFKNEVIFNDDKVRDSKADIDHQYDRLTLEQQARLTNKPEAEQEKVYKDISTAWFRTHHQRYIELCGLRLVKTLWYEWDNPKSVNLIYIASRTFLLAMSIVGLILAIARRWSLLYPLMLMGLSLLTFTLTITAARFSIPLEPIQFCWMALVIVTIARKFARRESMSPAPPRAA